MPKKKAESSLKGLSRAEKNNLESVVKEYTEFLTNGNTPERAVDEAINKAHEAGLVNYEEGFTRADNEKGFYMFDATERQFSIVLFGEKKAEDAGISMLVSHTDTPCFNLREHPIYELKNAEGLMLLAKPYGGLWRHQWLDTPIKIVGRFNQKGIPYDLELDAIISDRSIHITDSSELEEYYDSAFPLEMFKLVTGLESKKELMELLKTEGLDEDAFFNNTWYVVPANPGKKIGNLLAYFGHDDRLCVYSTVKAALESKNRVFPTIIHGAGREEIGSTGSDGALSTFLERTIDALLKAEGVDEKDISAALQRRVFSNSRMLSADLDIAMSAYDNISDEPRYNENIIGKFNRGVAVTKITGDSFQYEGHASSDEMAKYITSIFNRANVVYQTTENPSKLEYGGGGTVAVFYSHRGVPVIDVGPPCANMHGKYPLVHVGDLMQTIKAFKAFIHRKK